MEEEKNEKQKYGREQYKNLSENKKQRLAEYRKTLQNTKKYQQSCLIRFLFLVIRVDENALILGQPDAYEIKCIEFLY